MKATLITCLTIGVAGFFGALARFGVVQLFKRPAGAVLFPWATLVINVSGSAFLGWFSTFMDRRMTIPHATTLRNAIAIGFVGAYTTFSTYMFETNDLVSKGSETMALTYLVISLVLGLIGVRLGVILGR